MSRSKDGGGGPEDVSLVLDAQLSGLLEDPDTRAFVDAYFDINDPEQRATIEWFVYALTKKD